MNISLSFPGSVSNFRKVPNERTRHRGKDHRGVFIHQRDVIAFICNGAFCRYSDGMWSSPVKQYYSPQQCLKIITWYHTVEPLPSQQSWLEFGWYLVVFWLWGWQHCFNVVSMSSQQPNFNVVSMLGHWYGMANTGELRILMQDRDEWRVCCRNWWKSKEWVSEFSNKFQCCNPDIDKTMFYNSTKLPYLCWQFRQQPSSKTMLVAQSTPRWHCGN